MERPWIRALVRWQHILELHFTCDGVFLTGGGSISVLQMGSSQQIFFLLLSVVQFWSLLNCKSGVIWKIEDHFHHMPIEVQHTDKCKNRSDTEFDVVAVSCVVSDGFRQKFTLNYINLTPKVFASIFFRVYFVIFLHYFSHITLRLCVLTEQTH